MEKLKNLPRERHMFMARIGVASVIFLALTSVLMFRLVKLQVVDRAYYATRAEENRMRLSAVPPVRGLMTDRNGVLLAQNTPAFVLEIVPEQVKHMDDLLAKLHQYNAVVKNMEAEKMLLQIELDKLNGKTQD